MKNLMIFVILFSFSFGVLASKNEVEITSQQLDQLIQNTEIEADNAESPKRRNILRKLSDKFKKVKADLFDKTPDQKQVAKVKRRKALRKATLALGKGSTFVAVNTARPFVSTMGFFKGLFQKEKCTKRQIRKFGCTDEVKKKNIILQEALANFMIKHDDRLSNVWKSSHDPSIFSQKLVQEASDIIIETISKILAEAVEIHLEKQIDPQALYSQLGHSNSDCVDKALDIENLISDLDVLDIMKVTSNIIDYVNSHEDFQIYKTLIGDLTLDDITNISAEDLADRVGLESVGDYISKKYRVDSESIGEKVLAVFGEPEISGSILGQMAIPAITFNAIVGGLGTGIGVVTIAGNIGMIASTLACSVKEDVKAKMQDGDKELQEFCKYVVNKSAYTIARSRMKGYSGGRKARAYLKNKVFKKKKK